MRGRTDKNKTSIARLMKWGGIPFSLALVNIILYILDPNSIWWKFYKEISWPEFLFSTLCGVLMYAMFFAIMHYISKWMEHFSFFKQNIFVHFLTTTAVVLLSMFILLQLEGGIYALLDAQSMPDSNEMEVAFRNYFVANMIVAAFVNSVYNSFIFFERWKEGVVETNRLAMMAQELKTTALQSELEALKAQLDPHFLFNSFSILTQLIETKKEEALLFLATLSKVYRYILTNSKKDIITLGDELIFANNYFQLIKVRQGVAVNLEVDVTDQDKKKGIPPVTLQLLIENAIKYNICTITKPLIIRITSSHNGFITVSNNLQRIHIEYKSVGIGLQNIERRFGLLGESKPEIQVNREIFSVKLPLLNF